MKRAGGRAEKKRNEGERAQVLTMLCKKKSGKK